ncbi:multidrug efflux SMR transporter [Mechercharimyces sp. CAU 1602]|uniref:DMT family transporter n=1 Tax=Mechercharimyces sp. CAU 1602 TaxID=2973933 RepID=UPI002161B2CD|nr:multidrug efflux SMR transporter [Mechercharimyces sp. CAU 1602]MCS1350426.1 multidrug efflux SMR transporter [Mechercharimyces sp. CAU 1602]
MKMNLQTKAWLYVLSGGLLEVGWAVGLKYSTHWYQAGVTLLLIVLSFLFMSRAVKVLPIGTVYAVFTGLGAFFMVMVGIFFLDEPASWKRLFFSFLLISGIIGLKMSTSTERDEVTA